MGALRGQICGSKGCISRHRARSTDELGGMLAHIRAMLAHTLGSIAPHGGSHIGLGVLHGAYGKGYGWLQGELKEGFTVRVRGVASGGLAGGLTGGFVVPEVVFLDTAPGPLMTWEEC